MFLQKCSPKIAHRRRSASRWYLFCYFSSARAKGPVRRADREARVSRCKTPTRRMPGAARFWNEKMPHPTDNSEASQGAKNPAVGNDTSLDNELKRESNPLKRFFKMLGPGLVTGASDDDPSGIGTYAV